MGRRLPISPFHVQWRFQWLVRPTICLLLTTATSRVRKSSDLREAAWTVRSSSVWFIRGGSRQHFPFSDAVETLDELRYNSEFRMESCKDLTLATSPKYSLAIFVVTACIQRTPLVLSWKTKK